MREEKNSKFILILLISALLFLVGSISLYVGISNYRKDNIDEHFTHLLDLTHAVDHNLDSVLDYYDTRLNSLTSDSYIIEAAKKYFIDKDDSYFEASLYNGGYIGSINEKDLLITKDNDFFSLERLDLKDFDYSLLKDDNTIHVIESNDQSEVYIAISKCDKKSGIVFSTLIEYDDLYEKIVSSNIFSSYWVVIYNRESNLALQNSTNQPKYMIQDEQTILNRNDGYSEILKCEKEDKIGKISYSYRLADDEKYDAEISILPRNMSENRVFTIGVALFGEHINAKSDTWTLIVIISSLFISISVAILFFAILSRYKKESQLVDEVESLEKENKLLQEKSRLQEEIEHHKRLETIGTLTAGISHEFNNLLSPIMANSLLALEKIDEDSSLFEDLSAIYRSSEKAKKLVKRISKLSRKKNEYEMVTINPIDLIENTYSIVYASIPKNIKLLTSINSNRFIKGDESQLEYMLINLIRNSIQAIGDKDGTIILSLENHQGNVRITVEDNGIGINEKIIDKIFDPFYTTKEVGKGTGLGLSIANNIAMNHGGTLKAQNNEGPGASFIFEVQAINY